MQITFEMHAVLVILVYYNEITITKGINYFKNNNFVKKVTMEEWRYKT